MLALKLMATDINTSVKLSIVYGEPEEPTIDLQSLELAGIQPSTDRAVVGARQTQWSQQTPRLEAADLSIQRRNETVLAEDNIANDQQVSATDRDIKLYGYNVAAGAGGQVFEPELTAISGAGISASANLTSADIQASDWELELSQGDIEAKVSVDPVLAKSYSQVLNIKSANGHPETQTNFTKHPLFQGNRHLFDLYT